jgi:hypothetical protein
MLPLNQSKKELIKYLIRKKIQVLYYPKFASDDPYVVKFFLSSFIKQEGEQFENILYLDPDHIVVKEFNFTAKDETLYISSEVKTLNDIVSPDNKILTDNIKYHYNTSLIYGNRNSWLRALECWIDNYNLIKNSVTYRYREEVAFCLSAILAGINIIPVSTSMQSYFGNVNKKCRLFHYGGEYSESRSIKRSLDCNFLDYRDLNDTVRRANDEEEWIVSKMNEIINKGMST